MSNVTNDYKPGRVAANFSRYASIFSPPPPPPPVRPFQGSGEIAFFPTIHTLSTFRFQLSEQPLRINVTRLGSWNFFLTIARKEKLLFKTRICKPPLNVRTTLLKSGRKCVYVCVILWIKIEMIEMINEVYILEDLIRRRAIEKNHMNLLFD